MNIINWLRNSDLIFFQHIHINWGDEESSIINHTIARGQENKFLTTRMLDQNEWWEDHQDYKEFGVYTEGHVGRDDPNFIAELGQKNNFSNQKVDKIRTIIKGIIADPWKLKQPITIHFWMKDAYDPDISFENIYTIYPVLQF